MVLNASIANNHLSTRPSSTILTQTPTNALSSLTIFIGSHLRRLTTCQLQQQQLDRILTRRTLHIPGRDEDLSQTFTAALHASSTRCSKTLKADHLLIYRRHLQTHLEPHSKTLDGSISFLTATKLFHIPERPSSTSFSNFHTNCR